MAFTFSALRTLGALPHVKGDALPLPEIFESNTLDG